MTNNQSSVIECFRKTVVDKSIHDKIITKVTNYANGFIYESRTTVPADVDAPDYTDVLQFTGHEEGRIRYNGVTEKEKKSGLEPTVAFDYFIKDHLGNIRMVLTDEGKSDRYPAATLEESQVANERTPPCYEAQY